MSDQRTAPGESLFASVGFLITVLAVGFFVAVQAGIPPAVDVYRWIHQRVDVSFESLDWNRNGAYVSLGPVTDDLAAAGLITLTPHPAINADAVKALLDAIPAGATGASYAYSPDAFGPRWSDTDQNGCDQRNDVLARDLTDIRYTPGTHNCVVSTGTFYDSYADNSGPISYYRAEELATGTSPAAIDEVVPLRWAWQHGANTWSAEQREKFATDFANLQTTQASSLAGKSDQDGPASWLPPAESHAACLYVTRFTNTVSQYHLTLDDDDRSAIRHVLDACTPPRPATPTTPAS
ncbi:HNH endonuclease family protein [Clavibacter sepedonicus]|uniref:Secreted protein n=1 Tax=Clavibacter sepedonicus TaxID=31964 RepID=B0RJB4_CLASE|nr:MULTISPECIES: HNH endonuclease family protein [Clavibacter]MBD5383137.1 HNH endonuclease [Clavibacter sp.]OQJ45251.1 hypothetical protein B5P19_15410 [Clavibacter sepedonicus]OQJ50887.1 hypothetical protein B5P20_15745 [Clavibacter sepedonicus]UUK67312.1 HNH endonuclease family protein [Clavibacter sepedonicus]CAQ03304.1 putative secreted protein [Clavibacter sepedonicus]